MELSIITVTFNAAETVADTIEAFEAAIADMDAELIVVDNASADGTAAIARKTITRGRVIELPENVGYGRGINAGAVTARGRFLLITNDDVRIEGPAIRRLLEVADRPEIGVVAPMLVGEDGRPAPVARTVYPGLGEELLRIARALGLRRTVHDDGVARDSEGDGTIDAAWVLAACIVTRTELFRSAGGFNPAFFMYGEDIDLGRRLHELGYRSVVMPDALATHVQGATTERTYDDPVRRTRQVAGRRVYYSLWTGGITRRSIYLARSVGLRGQPDRLRLYGRAMLDRTRRSERFPPPLPANPVSPLDAP